MSEEKTVSAENKTLRERLLNLVTAANIFSLIGISAAGYFVYLLVTSKLSFFDDPNIARGLITFSVAILTIVLAMILVLAAVLGNSADIEKRFSMGKDILMVFVGILGTIMGFYYSENRVSPAVAREIAAAVPTKPTAVELEKKGFNSILANDFIFATDAFAEAYKVSPTFHNVDEINRLFQKYKAEFSKADTAKDENQKKTIWEKIYCEISKNYLWGIDAEIKKQFQEKMNKEGYNCPQAADSNTNSNTNQKTAGS